MRYPTHLSSRSSASNVGFCWAFSGVGWEACSCSRRRRWISCRISLDRMEERWPCNALELPLPVTSFYSSTATFTHLVLISSKWPRCETDTFLILLHLTYSIKQSLVVEKAVSTTKYCFQELEKNPHRKKITTRILCSFLGKGRENLQPPNANFPQVFHCLPLFPTSHPPSDGQLLLPMPLILHPISESWFLLFRA